MASHIYLVALLTLTAAPDGGTAPKKRAAGAPTITLPKFEALPTGAEVNRPSSDTGSAGPKLAPEGASYQVLSVQHALAFMKGPKGAAIPQKEALKIIPMHKGAPPATDRFSTVVRVKCAKRVGAPIELVVLNARGDTVMESSGQLAFTGGDVDEVDYQVDWASTPLRLGGEHQLLIRVAHQPVGTWPLNIEEPR